MLVSVHLHSFKIALARCKARRGYSFKRHCALRRWESFLLGESRRNFPGLQDTRLSRSSYPQQQTPCTVSHPQSAPLSLHNKLEDRIPLTLTFHPHSISVKNIISKNFKFLQHDPATAEIFAQPLLISYK